MSLGKIMHGDGHATLKVKLTSLAREVQKRIKDITALLADNSPPDLVLNRHCGQCEFQARCRKQATEKNELSLLSGMSEKERNKLHGKGIFTVTQLSYTFRPRRRRRELRGKAGEISSFVAGARNPREQDPRRRPSGPETRWHTSLSGCRRTA